jgi:hypothetical protein
MSNRKYRSGGSGSRPDTRHLAIRLPGGYRIGLDGLIGLIPGIGDGIGLLASGYIVAAAARLGAPKSILARMTLNVLLESLIGIIPVIGDLFDFAWKANLRNLALMNRYLDNPAPARKAARRSLLVIGVVALGLVAALVYALYHLIAWLWLHLITTPGLA